MDIPTILTTPSMYTGRKSASPDCLLSPSHQLCFIEIVEIFKLARVVCTHTKWTPTVMLLETAASWLVFFCLLVCQQLSILKALLICSPLFQLVAGCDKIHETAFI